MSTSLRTPVHPYGRIDGQPADSLLNNSGCIGYSGMPDRSVPSHPRPGPQLSPSTVSLIERFQRGITKLSTLSIAPTMYYWIHRSFPVS